MMNNYLKQVAYIIIVSTIFSFIRYLLIYEDYSLIKKSKTIDISSIDKNLDLEDLKKYLKNIEKPEVIDIELTKKIFNNNLAMFVDARDSESFQTSHIKGAINIPFENIDFFEKEYDLIWMFEQKEDFFYNIDNDGNDFILGLNSAIPFLRNPIEMNINQPINNFEKNIIVYCSGEGCSLSEELSFYLFDNFNFKRIMMFEGGMPIWENEGMPIE